MDLKNEISELYKQTATVLPSDVVKALKDSIGKENKPSISFETCDTILKNVDLAAGESKPICQDTGTPIFFVKYGRKYTQKQIKEAIIEATKKATAEIPLRPNAVDTLTGKNSGNNVFDGIPIIYFEEWENEKLEISLLLKGGGSENIGLTYKLPDISLNAGRDLKGVEKCILDAVIKAQGKGCPPYILSVVIGSPKDLLAVEAKKQLLRTLDSKNPNLELAEFEEKITEKINKLDIGPMGFGGKTTALKTFITACGRHPASYFVEISFFCWAARRGSIII
jgi:fumarate hydratase, class I